MFVVVMNSMYAKELEFICMSILTGIFYVSTKVKQAERPKTQHYRGYGAVVGQTVD
jgi:hypothetical protein